MRLRWMGQERPRWVSSQEVHLFSGKGLCYLEILTQLVIDDEADHFVRGLGMS